ncbi:MAG: hypothetical protein WAW88_06585 [Nocardioides sp.]
MILYADLPGRRVRQIVADLLFIAWVVLWVRLGLRLHDVALALAAPGRMTESSANRLGDQLSAAGGKVAEVPLVGDEVAVPFDKAAGAAESLAAAGRAQVEAVSAFAWWMGVLVAVIPILLVALFYLPARWRFVRAATAGRRFVDAAEDLDLFALRAMARQPLHVLARISDDPAGAWRRRDPEVVRQLADLELSASGLRGSRARSLTGSAGG